MDAFAAAIDDLFADPNIARAAIWRASGTGPGIPVRVIARRPDSVAEFGATRLAVETTLFDLRVSEVPDLAEGDTLDLAGETFVIQGRPGATPRDSFGRRRLGRQVKIKPPFRPRLRSAPPDPARRAQARNWPAG